MSYTAAVVTVNDKIASGEKENAPGDAVMMYLMEKGWTVKVMKVINGDNDVVASTLIDLADNQEIPLVLTVGGGGYSEASFVPEVTLTVIEREVRGIPELMRRKSMDLTPSGCLSRGVAGVRKKTLIVNLPGSEKAATENLAFGEDAMRHAVRMLWPNDTPKNSL